MPIGDLVATLSVSQGSASYVLSYNPGGFFAVSGNTLVEAIDTPAGQYSIVLQAVGPSFTVTQPVVLTFAGSTDDAAQLVDGSDALLVDEINPALLVNG
jgi:hypothetical protein